MSYEDLLSARLLVGPGKPLREATVLGILSEEMARRSMAAMDEQIRSILYYPDSAPRRTCEEMLAYAIEQRSLRSRLRRVRQRIHYRVSDYRARISLAIDVLRDRHDCYDY